MTDEEFRILYDEAFALKRAKRYAEARDSLRRLVLVRPDYAPVHGVLGGVLFELDEFDDAAEEFGIATRLSPRSELASLGLFHALNELGRKDAALAEMVRFTSVRDSAEYDLLRAEMEEKRDVTSHGEQKPQ